MKKFQILCLAVLCVTLMSACKDETGTYAEHLYTNSEKDAAVKACLNTSVLTKIFLQTRRSVIRGQRFTKVALKISPFSFPTY